MSSAAVAAQSADEDKTKVVTVDFTKKHPLEHSWTLWFDNPGKSQKSQTWGQTLRSVYTFNTIEDFWCLYNNIVPPSRLVHGADLHLFKEGVEPKWEDPSCANGGAWKVSIPKNSTVKQTLDQYWLNMLLALIGEEFPEAEEICGAVVNVRQRGDRVALWTKTASNEAAQIAIGKQLKETLEMGESARIGFLAHQDAMKLDRRAKDRFTI